MTALGAFVTFVLCCLVLAGNPRIAAAAIVLGTCYITQAQELAIGFHFTAIRLILLAGLARVICRGELKGTRTSSVDKPLIIYAVFLSIVSTLRIGTIDQLTYAAGGLYNIILSYFVFRGLLQSSEDIRGVLECLAFALVPMALLLVFEANTGRNVFAAFGGVADYSMVREGHVRAQGPFRSPITAGAFGATFAMLFSSLIFSGLRKPAALIGLIVSLTIVVCARSSGPLLGLIVGFVAMGLWTARQHTRKLRWGLVLSLVALHLVMKSPVWFLLGRISDLVGGGGYHRAYLIDHFVGSFNQWWLAGTNDTADWMATQLVFGGADITNQFVSDGLNAGLICLGLSVRLITRCFQSIGGAIDGLSPAHGGAAKLMWGLGAALCANVGILFSVTYFDQMHVIWYFLLAIIAEASLKPRELQELA